MRKLIIVSAFLLVTALPTHAAFPLFNISAGILPSSPFSFFDKAVETVQLTFTFNPVKKIALINKFAQEDLAEAAVEFDKGNIDDGTKALEEFTKHTIVTNELLVKIKADPTLESEKIVATQESVNEVIELGVATIKEIPQVINEIPPELEVVAEQAADAISELSIAIVDPVIPEPDTTEKVPEPPAESEKETIAPIVGCDKSGFDSCMKENFCTEETSEFCFKECPKEEYECPREDGEAGTCTRPLPSCVDTCLENISGCYDKCLGENDCEPGEAEDQVQGKIIDTTNLKETFKFSPFQFKGKGIKAFQFQLSK